MAAVQMLPIYLLLISFTTQCAGHMKMSYPIPLRSPALGGSNADYDLTSPLDPSGDNYPCKGYANDPWNQQASWTAGQTYTMNIAGGAGHDGGSCQLSLSYDKKTFRVIKSMIGGCPLATSYDFTVPADAPSGQALFAWTWQNEVGNREFYMNCAQVGIQGSSSVQRRSEALNSHPQIWVANLPGVNSCTTTEGVDPVYPNPGCDVVYGGRYSASSPPGASSSSGQCDFGSSQSTCSSSGSTSGVFAEDPNNGDSTFDGPESSVSPINGGGVSTASMQDPDMNMAEMPTSSSSQSLMSLSTITDFGPSSWATSYTRRTRVANATVLPETFPIRNNTPTSVIRTIVTGSAAHISSSMPLPPSTPSNAAYAGTDIMSYMPCKPGSFLCGDATTFYTCDQSTSASQPWVWQYPRKVAAGMMCQPQLVACSAGNDWCSTGSVFVPQGYTREDEYVRATR